MMNHVVDRTKENLENYNVHYCNMNRSMSGNKSDRFFSFVLSTTWFIILLFSLSYLLISVPRVLISTVPPRAHTFYNIHARISGHFVFSPDEDSCINYGNVGMFLWLLIVFTTFTNRDEQYHGL